MSLKPNQALDECSQIECHLRNLLNKAELEEAGATITPGRPLHFRVMRVIGHLKDRLAEVAPVEPPQQETPTREWLIKRVQWLSDQLDCNQRANQRFVAPAEPQTPAPRCKFCNQPTTMSQLIQAGACSDCAADELMPEDVLARPEIVEARQNLWTRIISIAHDRESRKAIAPYSPSTDSLIDALLTLTVKLSQEAPK